MAFKLSSKLVDVAKGSGNVIHKKEETHRMARSLIPEQDLCRPLDQPQLGQNKFKVLKSLTLSIINQAIDEAKMFTAPPNFRFYKLEVEQRLEKGNNHRAKKTSCNVKMNLELEMQSSIFIISSLKTSCNVMLSEANNIFTKWKINKGL